MLSCNRYNDAPTYFPKLSLSNCPDIPSAMPDGGPWGV